MKIGVLLLAIAVLGLATMRPGTAKVHRVHGVHRPGAHALKNPPAPEMKEKSESPGDNQIEESNRPGSAVAPAREFNMKRNMPENSQIRRLPASPSAPGSEPRNSIGEVVAPRAGTAAIGGHEVSPGVQPRVPAVAAGVQQHPASGAIKSAQSRGTINGSALIRPSVASKGLGGPAKTAPGINGTTLRPRP